MATSVKIHITNAVLFVVDFINVFCFYNLKSKSLDIIICISIVYVAIYELFDYRSVLLLNIYFMHFMLCFNDWLVVGDNGQLIEWSSISDSPVY